MRNITNEEICRRLRSGETLVEIELEGLYHLFDKNDIGYTKRSIGGQERYFVLKLLTNNHAPSVYV